MTGSRLRACTPPLPEQNKLTLISFLARDATLALGRVARCFATGVGQEDVDG